MSIILKGINMPISCEKCPLCYDYLYCSIDDNLRMFLYSRNPNCPLIETDLVTCGDCKYWDKAVNGHLTIEDHLCRRSLRWTLNTDYCSDGERHKEA